MWRASRASCRPITRCSESRRAAVGQQPEQDARDEDQDGGEERRVCRAARAEVASNETPLLHSGGPASDGHKPRVSLAPCAWISLRAAALLCALFLLAPAGVSRSAPASVSPDAPANASGDANASGEEPPADDARSSRPEPVGPGATIEGEPGAIDEPLPEIMLRPGDAPLFSLDTPRRAARVRPGAGPGDRAHGPARRRIHDPGVRPRERQARVARARRRELPGAARAQRVPARLHGDRDRRSLPVGDERELGPLASQRHVRTACTATCAWATRSPCASASTRPPSAAGIWCPPSPSSGRPSIRPSWRPRSTSTRPEPPSWAPSIPAAAPWTTGSTASSSIPWTRARTPSTPTTASAAGCSMAGRSSSGPSGPPSWPRRSAVTWSYLGGLDFEVRFGRLLLTSELTLQQGALEDRDLWDVYLQGVFEIVPTVLWGCALRAHRPLRLQPGRPPGRLRGRLDAEALPDSQGELPRDGSADRGGAPRSQPFVLLRLLSPTRCGSTHSSSPCS